MSEKHSEAKKTWIIEKSSQKILKTLTHLAQVSLWLLAMLG